MNAIQQVTCEYFTFCTNLYTGTFFAKFLVTGYHNYSSRKRRDFNNIFRVTVILLISEMIEISKYKVTIGLYKILHQYSRSVLKVFMYMSNVLKNDYKLI